MGFEIPARYLTRIFLREKVSITRKAIFNRIGDILETEDLAVESVSLIETNTGSMSPATLVKGPTGGWAVIAQASGVDVEYRPASLTENPTYEAFLSRSRDILSHVLKVSGQKAWRLACVQEGLLAEMPEKEMESVEDRVIRRPTGFGHAKEWDTRSVWRVPRAFSALTEECNEIMAVRRLQGEFGSRTVVRAPDGQSSIVATTAQRFDRIRIDLDINTLPTTEDSRFAEDDVIGFFDAAAKWHAELAQVAIAFATGIEL